MKIEELKKLAKEKGINIVSIFRDKYGINVRYFTFGEGWHSETKEVFYNSNEELEYCIKERF